MWLRNLSRDVKSGRRVLALGAAAALAAGLAAGLIMSGCSANYVEGDASSVLLLIEKIADGAPVLSDVRAGASNDSIVNCQVTATLQARPKNRFATDNGGTDDVRLLRYDVSYRRSDGRGVQGIDVPYSISGNLTQLVVSGNSADISFDLVRHQAKLEPPLSNIVGLQIVTMFADVTFSGQTVAGQAVQAKGAAQVTFADYATGTTTCEGS